MKLKGKVKSGLGQSSCWTKKFESIYTQKTGLKLFPGSLNIELPKDFLMQAAIRIEKEEFGDGDTVVLQPCKIFGRKAFILRTEPYSNNKIIEIVTDIKLRDVYNIIDEDEIEIEV